ncbi:MAG: hypothetical protein HC903_11415 [Methylacidiphilales bacterium]|nr:hypothetical protein [Candidatus Methylacidiphilales bacterium]NJR17763.1 hypothetical protein [Calothrix sp. CSU_2_0]
MFLNYQRITVVQNDLVLKNYRFPMEAAAKIALAEVEKFLKSNNSMEQVIFATFSQESYDCYLNSIKSNVGIRHYITT